MAVVLLAPDLRQRRVWTLPPSGQYRVTRSVRHRQPSGLTAPKSSTAGMRARITIADVTLGNNLAIESGRSQLAHRTALLCPGRHQTLKRTYQRRPARTQLEQTERHG